MYKTDTKNESNSLRATTLAIIKIGRAIKLQEATEKNQYYYRNI